MVKAVKGKKGVLEKKSEFLIAFVGLKDGIHEFDYHFDHLFFDSFENALIDDCQIDGQFILHKKNGLLEGEFLFDGHINTFCDRCGGDLDLALSGEERLIFKFTNLLESESDDIVFLPIDETELDVGPFFYEFISLNLPQKRLHNEADCDQEVIEWLDEVNFQESEELDPRWDALKKLKKKDLKK